VTDVTAHLAAADVLVAPSRNEGMGRVLVEALALGVPVVGTAVGGIPDVIVDGECGVLVPPEDPPALAEALADLGLDVARRAKLAAAAAPHAEAFSTAVAGAAMTSIYDRLVRARGLRR
jgi:glycosyltransferase involved in cell wall biosynthesis